MYILLLIEKHESLLGKTATTTNIMLCSTKVGTPTMKKYNERTLTQKDLLLVYELLELGQST